MLPEFLLPETTVREAGVGPAMSLGDDRARLLTLTLGITRIVEQESLDLAVCGSADGTNWDPKPLVTFPQKFYCGTYQIVLDLSSHPDVRYLRAAWRVNRWGRGDATPLFSIYLFAKALEREAAVVGAA